MDEKAVKPHLQISYARGEKIKGLLKEEYRGKESFQENRNTLKKFMINV